jgi:hypothetical protein
MSRWYGKGSDWINEGLPHSDSSDGSQTRKRLQTPDSVLRDVGYYDVLAGENIAMYTVIHFPDRVD